MLFVGLMWAKLSLFNRQPDPNGATEWYTWSWQQAALADISSLASLLILTAPLMLLAPARRFVAFWLADLTVTLIVLADVLHFRFYGDIASLSSASAAWQLPLIWRNVAAVLRPRDLLAFSDLAVVALVWLRIQRALRSEPPEPRWFRRAVAGCVFGSGCLLAIVPIRIIRKDTDAVFQRTMFRFFGARRIGLLTWHLYEGRRLLDRALFARQAFTTAEREHALTFVAGWRPTATERSPLFGVARGKNLIIIMVESLHGFPMGLKIGDRDVMPNLTAFANRSLYFSNFYGQTAEGNTSDGEFTSLQSLYPLAAGSVQSRFPTNTYRGLPAILAERSYATMSAHGYFGDLWNMRTVHPRLGFQRSFFREDYTQTEAVGMGLPDGEFFNQTLPRLEREPQPFMAFLITLSTHNDWNLPEKYQTFAIPGLTGAVLGEYLQSLHYFDTVLGEFIGQLERDGLLDRSVVAIYGDHRAHFGAGDASNQAELAKLFTRYSRWAPPDTGLDVRYWQAAHRLPLIIHLPHDEAAGPRPVTGGHLDIAPTLLNLLGIENSDMVTLGRDLTRGVDEFVVFRNGSFVQGDTLCVTLDASVTTARCRNTRTGDRLDPAGFATRFDQARERLHASDVLIEANLIPKR